MSLVQNREDKWTERHVEGARDVCGPIEGDWRSAGRHVAENDGLLVSQPATDLTQADATFARCIFERRAEHLGGRGRSIRKIFVLALRHRDLPITYPITVASQLNMPLIGARRNILTEMSACSKRHTEAR
jgi:hypothetical protein